MSSDLSTLLLLGSWLSYSLGQKLGVHAGVDLLQLLKSLLFDFSSFGDRQNQGCSRVVDGVVEKLLNVRDKQRVEHVDDPFPLSKRQRSLVRNPHALEMHGANLDHVSDFLRLENAVPSASCHSHNIEQLGAVDHVVILTSGHTYAACFDLEAQRSLVLPQCSGYSCSERCVLGCCCCCCGRMGYSSSRSGLGLGRTGRRVSGRRHQRLRRRKGESLGQLGLRRRHQRVLRV